MGSASARGRKLGRLAGAAACATAGAAAVATLLAGCASPSSGSPGAPPSGSAPTEPGATGLRGAEVTSIQCASTMFQPDGTAATLPDTPVRVVICPLPMPNAVSTKADLRPPPSDLLRVLSLPDTSKPTGTPYACAAYGDVPRLVYAQLPDGTLYLLHIPVDACGHYLVAALSVVNHYAHDGPPSH